MKPFSALIAFSLLLLSGCCCCIPSIPEDPPPDSPVATPTIAPTVIHSSTPSPTACSATGSASIAFTRNMGGAPQICREETEVHVGESIEMDQVRLELTRVSTVSGVVFAFFDYYNEGQFVREISGAATPLYDFAELQGTTYGVKFMRVTSSSC